MMKRMLPISVFKAAFFFLGAVWLFSNANSVFGCKIEMKVLGETKEVYALNDVIQLKISFEFTHRVCPIAMDDSKITANGLEITEASEWKETKPRRNFEKELKLKVVGNKEGKLTLSMDRTCEFGGGSGSITFKSEPIK
jgi:hypothetical protein